MNMTVVPAVLLIGPSGVGKSMLARHLEARGFLHLDIDQHHGFKANGLRREWHRFSSETDVGPLCGALQERVALAVKQGVLISLPSTRVLSRAQVEIAKRAGISTVLLWGTEEQCKSARRSRDEAEGRSFDETRYNRSNASAFKVYGTADFDDVRIEAFDTIGAHRSGEDIVTEAIARISG